MQYTLPGLWRHANWSNSGLDNMQLTNFWLDLRPAPQAETYLSPLWDWETLTRQVLGPRREPTTPTLLSMYYTEANPDDISLHP